MVATALGGKAGHAGEVRGFQIIAEATQVNRRRIVRPRDGGGIRRCGGQLQFRIRRRQGIHREAEAFIRFHDPAVGVGRGGDAQRVGAAVVRSELGFLTAEGLCVQPDAAGRNRRNGAGVAAQKGERRRHILVHRPVENDGEGDVITERHKRAAAPGDGCHHRFEGALLIDRHIVHDRSVQRGERLRHGLRGAEVLPVQLKALEQEFGVVLLHPGRRGDGELLSVVISPGAGDFRQTGGPGADGNEMGRHRLLENGGDLPVHRGREDQRIGGTDADAPFFPTVEQMSGRGLRGQCDRGVEREIPRTGDTAGARGCHQSGNLIVGKAEHRHQVAVFRRREGIVRLGADKGPVFRPVEEGIRQHGRVGDGRHRHRQAFADASSAVCRPPLRRGGRDRDFIITVNLEVRLRRVLLGHGVSGQAVFIDGVLRVGAHQNQIITSGGRREGIALLKSSIAGQSLFRRDGDVQNTLSAGGVEHLYSRGVPGRRGSVAAVGQGPGHLAQTIPVRIGNRKVFDHQVRIIAEPHREWIGRHGDVVPLLQNLVHIIGGVGFNNQVIGAGQAVGQVQGLLHRITFTRRQGTVVRKDGQLDVIGVAVNIVGGKDHPVHPQGARRGQGADVPHLEAHRDGVAGARVRSGDVIHPDDAQVGEVHRRGRQRADVQDVVAVDSHARRISADQRVIAAALRNLHLRRIVTRQPIGLRHERTRLVVE